MLESISPPKGGFFAPQKACARCGEVFSKALKLSSSQWASRQFCSKQCSATKHGTDIALMSRMYQAQKLSSTEIGQLVGMSASHVRRLLSASGVQARHSSENKRLSAARPETKARMRSASTGRKHKPETIARLKAVHGQNHPLWRGGITITAQGYQQYTSSLANGQKAGRLVHQVVAEEKYGESRIKQGLHVHHVDGNKLNNAPANLLLMTDHAHAQWHAYLRSQEWQAI